MLGTALVQGEPIAPLSPDRHPVAVYLAGLAAGSRATQRSALRALAGLLVEGCDMMSLPWWHLSYAHCVGLVAVLRERYAPATSGRMLSALRGVLRSAFLLGLYSAEDWARVKLVHAPGGTRERAGRGITGDELARLFRTLAERGALTPATAARDAAILALLYGCGLRRAELAGLGLGDVDRIAWALKVRGKGDKHRTVPVAAEGARRALAAWLVLRGALPGPLFLAVYKGGAQRTVGLGTKGIAGVLERLAVKAGVEKLRPHDLRRSYCSDLLDLGTDLALVSQLVGHASVRTTAGYDRRPARARAAAAALLTVPYLSEVG